MPDTVYIVHEETLKPATKVNKMVRNSSTILINAPKQAVWETLTRADLVKRWQYGSDLITSWEVGSDIRFKTEWEGTVFEQWGTVLEMRLHELVKYNLFAPRPGIEDRPENYFIMNYIISSENNQTRLEIIQEDSRPNAIQEKPQGEENPVLQALKKVAETYKNDLPETNK